MTCLGGQLPLLYDSELAYLFITGLFCLDVKNIDAGGNLKVFLRLQIPVGNAIIRGIFYIDFINQNAADCEYFDITARREVGK